MILTLPIKIENLWRMFVKNYLNVVVFNNETKSQELFRIRANQWIDFNASYAITDVAAGKNLGKIARKGMRSLWKATYHIIDEYDQPQFTVQEENAWIKVGDAFLSEIPILGIFTGYLFNPSYIVKDKHEHPVFRLKKIPSFFGRKFVVEKIGNIEEKDEGLIILSLMMMVLLEREEAKEKTLKFRNLSVFFIIFYIGPSSPPKSPDCSCLLDFGFVSWASLFLKRYDKESITVLGIICIFISL